MRIDAPTILKIANLTSNGVVTTSSSDGTLGVKAEGAGGGLNADTVDGSHASAFAASEHGHAQSEVTNLVSDLSGKEPTLSKGNLTATAPVVLDQTRQVIGGAAVVSMAKATGSVNGYLGSDDWTTFNNKEPQLAWQNQAFSASDFTGKTTMTWTVASGDLKTFRYRMSVAGEMLVQVKIDTSTLSGTATDIVYVKIPNGKAVAFAQPALAWCWHAGAWEIILVEVSGYNISFFRISGNFTLSTDGFYLRAQLFFEVAV